MKTPSFTHTHKTGRRHPHFAEVNMTVLGKACGITSAHAAQVLAGRKGASMEVWRRLARALGMTVEELTNRVEEIRRVKAADSGT